MARPSRGFTVAHSDQPVAPLCPVAILLTLNIVDVDNYQYICTWSPLVTVGTLTLYGSVDGEDLGPMYVIPNAVSGNLFAFDPAAWGTSGQTLSCYAQATDIDGCPDVDSNSQDTEIP